MSGRVQLKAERKYLWVLQVGAVVSAGVCSKACSGTTAGRAGLVGRDRDFCVYDIWKQSSPSFFGVASEFNH